ncbi:MAG: hypothetical protein AAGD00_03735 [Planctomycetota bacterium]
MARTRMLHNLSMFAGALAVASMLSACGGGSSEPADNDASGSDAQASAAPPENASPSASGEGASMPASATGDEIPTQATSAGAVQLFIDAMREGDYESAKLICHPQALGQDKLDTMQRSIEQMEEARENTAAAGADDAQVAELDATIQLLRVTFTNPWQNVEARKVVEQGDKARYHLSFAVADAPGGRASRAIDVFEIDEAWFVFIPEWVDIPLSQIMSDPANDDGEQPTGDAAPTDG